MYIQRDITARLNANRMPIQIILGPRQCGKSTLLSHIGEGEYQEVTFDDLQLRLLANRDPRLFLQQCPPPVLLDEIQYVPNLFPEMKQWVDEAKKQRLKTGRPVSVLFRLTGSNQVLLDTRVKESLAGRASYYYLNTLTVHEIRQALPGTTMFDILYRGGWPELHIDGAHSPIQYLNDYIRSYIEKDIVLSAGIQKQDAFNTMLALLAARTGMLLDYTGIARDTGIQAVTIKEWIAILERTSLVHCLKPYSSNLNKRLTKTPKLYFLDTGLAVRLQGWREQLPLTTSPQAGPLFETLVFCEIIKFIHNYGKDWQLYVWRTKEGEEIDFLILTASGKAIALDAKMSIQSTRPIPIPTAFHKLFPETKHIILVTLMGRTVQLSEFCLALPLEALHDYLMTVN